MNSDDLASRKASLSEAKRALLLQRLRGKTTGEQSDAALSRVTSSEPQPLSFTQQRVWLLQQLFPDNRAYNMSEAWRVRGNLDVDALQQALNEVAERQPSLRTIFTVINDQPMQAVTNEIDLALTNHDLTHLPPEARQATLDSLTTEEAVYDFDLKAGPLLRLVLIRLDAADYVLMLTLHHIITDEWSNDIFWRELDIFYRRALDLDTTLPADMALHYSDYAIWQRERVSSGALDPQMSYWQNQLGGSLSLLQLPLDRQRPATQSFSGGMVRSVLPESVVALLEDLGRESGSTLFMTLLAAFQALLYRYSGQETILVGTPMANRTRLETQDLMGMFVNTVVMRADLSEDLTFRQLLDQVRQTTLDALANQDLPFDRLVKVLSPDRDLSYNPLFQVMFVYQSSDNVRGLPAVTFEPLAVDMGTAKFDLTLFAGKRAGHVEVALEYSDALFDPATASRIMQHWQTLTNAAARNADLPLASLPLLGSAESDLVLKTWNGPSAVVEETRSIPDLISEHAANQPQAVAVMSEREHLTFGELEVRANQLAHRLIESGIKAGTPVGLLVERSPAMIVGIIGILKAGGAYVPLDPSYPPDRIAYMVDDSQIPIIITQPHLADRLPPDGPEMIALDTSYSALAGALTHSPQTTTTLDDLAYLIYTSGSTGKPKGVMVTHRNLLYSTLARKEYYQAPVERYLLLSSFAFDSSVAGIFWTLVDGGMLVLPATHEEQDIQKLSEIIANEQVTHTLALPSLYRLLLDYAPAHSLDSLRTVIVAGEACSPDLGAIHYGRLPDTELYNEYGPTEATVWCTVYHLPREGDTGPVPIGKPIPNSNVFILDRHMQPVPIGVAGELYVGGAGVTRGYWNNPVLSSERFVSLELGDEVDTVRVYKTGDLARWRADGQIEFLGRVDDQVKIRGYRVEPDEIANVLVQHEALREVAVLAVTGEPGNELLRGRLPSVEELRQALQHLDPDLADQLLSEVENS